MGSSACMSHCRLATICLLGIFLATVFVLTAETLIAFTPIYTPMSCNNTESEFGRAKMDSDGNTNIHGTATTVCENPNRATFDVNPIGNVTLYLVLGDSVTESGTATFSPVSYVEHGATSMDTNCTMMMNRTQVASMLRYSRENGFPMMASRTEVWGRAVLRLYGLTLRTPWRKRKTWCAWKIEPMSRKGGSMVCGESLEEIRGRVADPSDPIVPFPIVVSKTKLDKAARMRNWFCAIVMTLSFGCMVSSAICAGQEMRRRSPKAETPANGKATEDDDDTLKLDQSCSACSDDIELQYSNQNSPAREGRGQMPYSSVLPTSLPTLLVSTHQLAPPAECGKDGSDKLTPRLLRDADENEETIVTSV